MWWLPSFHMKGEGQKTRSSSSSWSYVMSSSPARGTCGESAGGEEMRRGGRTKEEQARSFSQHLSHFLDYDFLIPAGRSKGRWTSKSTVVRSQSLQQGLSALGSRGLGESWSVPQGPGGSSPDGPSIHQRLLTEPYQLLIFPFLNPALAGSLLSRNLF